MGTVVKRQVANDAYNVSLELLGVFAKLVDPLEELQTPVGHNVVTVTLYLDEGHGDWGEF